MVQEIIDLVRVIEEQVKVITRRTQRISQQIVNLSAHSDKITRQASKIKEQVSLVGAKAQEITVLASAFATNEMGGVNDFATLSSQAKRVGEQARKIFGSTGDVYKQVNVIVNIMGRIYEQLNIINVHVNVIGTHITTISHQVVVIAMLVADVSRKLRKAATQHQQDREASGHHDISREDQTASRASGPSYRAGENVHGIGEDAAGQETRGVGEKTLRSRGTSPMVGGSEKISGIDTEKGEGIGEFSSAFGSSATGKISGENEARDVCFNVSYERGEGLGLQPRERSDGSKDLSSFSAELRPPQQIKSKQEEEKKRKFERNVDEVYQQLINELRLKLKQTSARTDETDDGNDSSDSS